VFNFEGVYIGERVSIKRDCSQSQGQRRGEENEAWGKSQKRNGKEEGTTAQKESKIRSFNRSLYQEKISVGHTIDKTPSMKPRRFAVR
jgi:hypothetical protein